MWRILLLCGFSGLLHAQPTFERVYGLAKGEAFHSVLATADGGILAAGYTSSFDPLYTDGYVLKLNAQGDTVWSRIFGQAYVEEANVVLETPLGYIIGGTHVPTAPVTYDMYVACYDAAGTLLWQNFYGGSGSEGIHDGLVNQAGRLVFCGYSTTFTNGASDMYLIETDLQGNVVRSAHVGGNGNEQALGIWQAANGDYILIGYSNTTDPVYNIYVARLDSTFALIWTKEFGGSKEDLGFDVAEDDSGNLWLLGFHYVAADSLLLTLIRTDPQGANAQYHYPASVGDFGYRLLRHSSGLFVVAGVTHTLTRGSQMMALAVDTNGQPQWKAAFGGTYSDVAFCLAETNAGQLLLGGTTEGFGSLNVNAYLVRCNDGGQVPCPDAVSFHAVATKACEDQTLFFTNTTVSSQLFTWYLNGQALSTTDHWGYYFNESGTFTVAVTACTAAATATINIWPKPPAVFTYQQQNDTVFFSLVNPMSYASLVWDFGDNSPPVQNDPSPAHVFPGVGPFWVTLSVTSPEGCDSVYTAPVMLVGKPTTMSVTRIFPNPARKAVLLPDHLLPWVQALLYHDSGTVVRRVLHPPKMLSLDGIPSGIYVLQLDDASGMSYSALLAVQ
ncbi:MAG: hypothetical protein NZL95_02280 [Chitinophagales bacterium]|nr:hypothetical protein [Chitinophagales bacterium]MDW8427360.1 hypothetical protein [Chitinophagales bacterium]